MVSGDIRRSREWPRQSPALCLLRAIDEFLMVQAWLSRALSVH